MSSKASPYYVRYDRAAEHHRGYWLLAIFIVLTLVTLFLWVWPHLPNMFYLMDGQWDWHEVGVIEVAPPTPAPTEAGAVDSGSQPVEAVASAAAEPAAAAKREPLQYLDWLLASLLGALVYTLANIAQFLPKIRTEEAHFRAFTGWYISTTVRGTIIAQVVMWLLVNVQVEVAAGEAVAINLGSMPPLVLTGTAFILGFYGRVARAQLDLMTQALFRKAWLMAAERFEVLPSAVKVIFGKQVSFKVDPSTDVHWTVDGGGAIDQSGLYTAPARSADHEPGSRVTVRAALAADPSISAVATVTLVPFRLVAERTTIGCGEILVLTIDAAPSEGVELECSAGTCDGLTYRAPTADEAKGSSSVTVMARRKLKQGEKEEDRLLDKDSITLKLRVD